MLAGEIGLDKAGETVTKDRGAGRIEADRLAWLRDDRPDVAGLVADGGVPIWGEVRRD